MKCPIKPENDGESNSKNSMYNYLEGQQFHKKGLI